MGTPKQIESARRNGAKSKGPVTPEGKAKSSRNAVKHGLAADPATILASENNDDYDRLLQAYMDTFQPVNGAEHDLVCQVVSAAYRLRRIGRIEASLLDDQMETTTGSLDRLNVEISEATVEAQAFRSLASGRSLDLIIRYNSATRRAFDSALKTLRDVQRERRKAEIQNEPDLAKAPKESTRRKGPSSPVGPTPAVVAIFPAPPPAATKETPPPSTAPPNEPLKEGWMLR